jgi:hypothetical protein
MFGGDPNLVVIQFGGDPNLVVIPYVAGLSEAIRRVGDTVGIKTVFSSGDTLKKRLTHVKPKGKGKEKDLIYKIPCKCGAKYIGETGRPEDIAVVEKKEYKDLVVIPYVAGLSEAIRRVGG